MDGEGDKPILGDGDLVETVLAALGKRAPDARL